MVDISESEADSVLYPFSSSRCAVAPFTLCRGVSCCCTPPYTLAKVARRLSDRARAYPRVRFINRQALLS